jgi:hypothetical protein
LGFNEERKRDVGDLELGFLFAVSFGVRGIR